MSRLAIRLFVAALALAPLVAGASQQGVVVGRNWRSMDQCAKEAQTAFPDFTAEANAKRDARLNECLANKNMPPRQPLSPGR